MNNAALEARRAYIRNWKKKNHARLLEYQKKWRKENPEKVKQYAERYWEKKAAEAEQG